jgi:hypothetical protein
VYEKSFRIRGEGFHVEYDSLWPMYNECLRQALCDPAAIPGSSLRQLAADQRALVIGWRWLLGAVALVAAALLALALFAR